MAVFPLPRAPSRRAAGVQVDSFFKLYAPADWARFPVSWLWSRRLTEPPRPASVGAPHNDGISGPKGWRGRSESCQTGSVHRLASAEATPPRLSPQRELSCTSRMTEGTPSLCPRPWQHAFLMMALCRVRFAHVKERMQHHPQPILIIPRHIHQHDALPQINQIPRMASRPAV